MLARGCRIVLALIVATIAGSATIPVFAEEADAVNLIIKSLAPIGDQIDPSMMVSEDIGGETVTLQPGASIDIEVHFARNSTGLDEQARLDLMALGEALTSEALQHYRYLVAGHTDATGAADYNQMLSEQRAQSVRNFLIETFAIEAERLESVGWGESKPKDATAPTAAANRRVEVTLIVPPGGYPVPVEEPGLPPPEGTPPPGTLQTDGSGGIKIVF